MTGYPQQRPAKYRSQPVPVETESELQTTVANFLNWALPDGAMWWHVPNEGKRGFKAQRDFKAWGGKAGVLDIHILWSARFIVAELKRKGKRMTKAQEEWADQVTLCGGLFLGVFDNLDDFVASLGTAIPLKRVELQ